MKIPLAVLVSVALCTGASAQEPSTELVLVPLVVANASGARGSLWTTEIRIHNSSDEKISFGEQACTLGFCSFYDVPAHTTAEPLVASPDFPRLYPGTYLYFSRQELQSLTFSARVYDESRTGVSWGVAVPIVRWSEVRPQVLRFPGVPASGEFRYTLRLYALAPTSQAVTVRYFNDDVPAAPPFAAVKLSLRSVYLNETYAEISSADSSVLPGVNRVRLEVVADDPTLPVWGMLSITNNETQFVTLQTAPN